MVLINPNDNNKIENSKEIFNWKCSNCGREHSEEKRNFARREMKCTCQKIVARAKEMNDALAEQNYLFLIDEENSYSPTSTGMMDLKKPIYVKCLKCGKESYEYYHNLRIGHKKCNCNSDKKFTLHFSTEDFVNKWHFLNKENFTLVDGEEYKNRNSKYKIKCNNCGKEDIRLFSFRRFRVGCGKKTERGRHSAEKRRAVVHGHHLQDDQEREVQGRRYLPEDIYR